MTTFTQPTARLKNFSMGWLLILGLKEGLVECATVCLKNEVILLHLICTSFLWLENTSFLVLHSQTAQSVYKCRSESCTFCLISSYFRLKVFFYQNVLLIYLLQCKQLHKGARNTKEEKLYWLHLLWCKNFQQPSK